MDEHRVDDDLFGDLQEKLVEASYHDGGMLGEVDDLRHRARRQVGRKPRRLFDGLDLGADARFPLRLARNHEGSAQRFNQVVGACELDARRGEEAMPVGGATGFGAGEGQRHDGVAQKRHDPTNGTAELLAIRRPTLRLGPCDPGDHLVEHIGKQAGDVERRRRFHGVDVLDAVLVAPFESRRVDALAAREAERGLGRLPLGIEGDLGCRAAKRLFGGLGLLRHVMHDGDQASRRGIGLDPGMGDLGGIHERSDELGKLLRGGMERERRQLFRSDLEGERLIRHLRPPCPGRRHGRRRVRYSSRSTLWRSSARAGCSPCARWRR